MALNIDSIKLDETTGDVTTPVDGQLWYNTTTDKLRTQEGAVAVDVKTRDASELTSGTLDDARVAQSNVTQHQAALSVTASQVSDFNTAVGSTPPQAHALGGAQHTADTLANLNLKITDATLDDAGASRPPSGAASGDLTGTYPSPTVALDTIDNTKLTNMSQNRVKGRAATAGSGDPQDLTPGQVREIVNVEDGATKGVVLEDEGIIVTGGNHTTLNFTGAGVSVADAGAGEATITIAGGGGSDELVGITASDTTPGYLDTKITVTTNKLVKSVTAPGGDERLNLTIGSDVFDKSVDTTDNITEGATNLFTSVDENDLIVNALGTRWLDGLATAPQGVPDKTVAVSSGNYFIDAVKYTHAGTDPVDLTSFFTALTGGQRQIVELYIDAGNTILTLGGTPETGSKKALPPAHPTNTVCISYVKIDKDKGTITTAEITDCRVQEGAGALDTDELVKITAEDTTAKYLQGALSNNGNITFTLENAGGDESLKADAPTASTTVAGVVELATDGESAANLAVQANDSRLSDNRTDADAIHDNVAGEIAAITEKTTPVGADLILIEDSADSNNKKRVQITNLPSGGGGLAYVEKWSSFSATSNMAWHTITLTGISANMVISVTIDPGSNNNNGVRAVGSSLERKKISNRPFTLQVKTDGSSQIEVWADDKLTTNFIVSAELGS